MLMRKDAEAEARSRCKDKDSYYYEAVGVMQGLRQAAEAVCSHPTLVDGAGSRHPVCGVCWANLTGGTERYDDT